MRGFASTIILLSILSLVTTQVNLQNELQSSMFEQQVNIQLMQRTNEKVYNIENGFKKTVKEAHNEAKKANFVLKLAGIDANYAIEPYVCSKIISWANGKYNMKVAIVDKFEITELILTEDDFDEDKLKLSQEHFEKINKNNVEFPSFSCLSAIDTDKVNIGIDDFEINLFTIEVGWPDIFEFNSIQRIKKRVGLKTTLYPLVPSFVFEEEILGQKINVIIPGGTLI